MSKAAVKVRKRQAAKKRTPNWELRLYAADTTARSVLATENLQSFCEHYLHGLCRPTIIDLVRHPELERTDSILAIPAFFAARTTGTAADCHRQSGWHRARAEGT